MALSVKQVELYQFRNYRSFSLDDIGGVTVFVGENAVGKTNLLEALHLLTACQSFRHATTEQLLMEDVAVEQARAAAVLADETRKITIEMVIDGGKRRWKMNGKVKPSGELRGLAPSVVFTPDDLALIKGSHSAKRMALDALGEQLKPNYQQVRLNYEDILRQKNKLLKEGYSADFLAGINDVMVVCGAQLTLYRSSLFDKLAPKIIARYAELSGGREQLSCTYVPSWILHGQLGEGVFTLEEDDEEGSAAPFSANSSYFPVGLTREKARAAMQQALDNRSADECIRQRAFIGPHMDKIFFTLDGKDAGDYAS
ncbi:MAG: AAA family ATPase, partial [Eggerthellaceae bacterium]|nr:AAA family ATPase [Eggerthellaceae bacterium]